jgi:hypothetical protein
MMALRLRLDHAEMAKLQPRPSGTRPVTAEPFQVSPPEAAVYTNGIRGTAIEALGVGVGVGFSRLRPRYRPRWVLV